MEAVLLTAVLVLAMALVPVSSYTQLMVLNIKSYCIYYFADKAGNGGISWSGDAIAGQGGLFGGNGGNAKTGNTGNANGGSVINSGALISNSPGTSMYTFRFPPSPARYIF